MNELYTTAVKSFWDNLAKGIEIVIATADGDDLTARVVSVAPHDGKLYFSTLDNSTKCAQIQKNPKVALCVGPIQVRGAARILGDLNSGENKAAFDALNACYPNEIARFCMVPGIVLIEITPITGSFGSMETGDTFVLDFAGQTAQKITNEM